MNDNNFRNHYIFLTRIVFVFVVVRRVRRVRRRRPPPSVLRPVRPSPSSVVVVLCPSVRPVRPSSSSPTCESKAACNFSKLQNMNPTATRLGASDRARSGDFSSRPEIAVRVEKVGFTTETLLL